MPLKLDDSQNLRGPRFSISSSLHTHLLRPATTREPRGTMNSINRKFGKLMSKGGANDSGKVSVLLNDYEDADSTLAKVSATIVPRSGRR